MLLSPLGVSPPNNIAVFLVIDVIENSLIGGGLSPVTVGVIHSSKNDKPILIQTQTHTDTHTHTHVCVCVTRVCNQYSV